MRGEDFSPHLESIMDLIGRTFSRLTVVSRLERDKHGAQFWECVCLCGKVKKVRQGDLISGHIRSCGCLRRETNVARLLTHGLCRSSEYKSWECMKKRCYNKNEANYKDYGGRGIKVCERWLHSFENFLKDMGNKPSSKHSLDRIDNNGDYCPENCRWATRKEQSNNSRRNILIKYLGVVKTLPEWCEVLGLNYHRTKSRLFKYHWTVPLAFSSQPSKYNSRNLKSQF